MIRKFLSRLDILSILNYARDMDEIWKPVPSREGVMASSLGRIKLPDRQARMPHGGMRWYRPKPTYGVTTKASKTARHTYKGIFAIHFGNMKIHRLVCEAFHGPSPFDGAVVIHLDEDAHNNKPENLKWGSQKENLNMPKIKAFFSQQAKSRPRNGKGTKGGFAKKSDSIF